jgi:hypothetical protein
LQRFVERHEGQTNDVLNVSPFVQAVVKVLHHELVTAVVAEPAAEVRLT